MPEKNLETLRHSTAHVMAQAVYELFPGTKLTIGPSIENGFYYDFDIPEVIRPESLKEITSRMRKIINKNLPFTQSTLTKSEAVSLFEKRSEPYKVELLKDIGDEEVSIFTQGDFFDLCKGPHLSSTGEIKAFKLLSIAGSYWRGSEKNKMLQRIYGTAFFTKNDLFEHLKKLEEAKKRDHRKIGRELDLFSIDDEIGPGLINWHPKGAKVRGVIEDFWRKQHYHAGYDIVYSPHVAKIDLWKTSGHWDFYRENIYSPMEVDGSEYIVKPMNCPFHIKIFKSKTRSYRDLPLRWAELGTVYRYERSGVLHGLLRVRGFTQDDAHIFCRQETLKEEITKVLTFTLFILRSFGFIEYEMYISTKPDKYVGSDEEWVLATDALTCAVQSMDLPHKIDPGEGVFYGPKIDVKIKDSIGRLWQCSTIQVDFNLPERFDLHYIGEDGGKHRPIMIHRALMGSLERFFGCLVEHFGGAFPFWLAPLQVMVIPITSEQKEYAQKITESINDLDYRVECDMRNEKLGYKIRDAQTMKIPIMIIIGANEVTTSTVSVRKRDGSSTGEVSMDKLILLLKEVSVH